MKKFARDLSDELKSKVKKMADELGITSSGIQIEPIRMTKSKKDFGVVMKSSDLVTLFTGNDSLVVVALFEDLFDIIDEKSQEILIRSLLDQIVYDMDKDKITINKPEIQLMQSVYAKYGDDATQTMEAALAGIQQLNEAKKNS